MAWRPPRGHRRSSRELTPKLVVVLILEIAVLLAYKTILPPAALE